ncbi:ABC transporter substrate-binding protein [Vandammella animalimorsus]|nr:ABC transporter substrate-binding protein [Vandammella animalimorsus]
MLRRRALLQALACGAGAGLLAPWARPARGEGQPVAQPTAQSAQSAQSAQPILAESSPASLLQHFGPPMAAAPRRIVAAGPPAAVLVAALAPAQLLGWPMPLPDAARALLAPGLARLPTIGRLAGRGSTLGTEGLLALRPELIVDVGSTDDYYRSQAQRLAQQTGIPYVLVDGSLPHSAQQLREVGQLLGAAQRAAQLAQYAQQALAQAQQLRQRLQAQPPRFYLARGADGLETGWRGSINSQLLEYLGAHNVAAPPASQPGRPGRQGGGTSRVPLEQLLQWNPQLIVTQQPGLAEQLRQHPQWRSVQAVRQGLVLQIPHLPFGWVDGPPGINRLIGLRWLSLLLQHWDGATALEAAALRGRIEPQARAFYQLFYGCAAGVALPPGALP